MWGTNLKIFLTVVGTLAVYTAVANLIPQVQSAVPEEVEIGADATPEQLATIGGELYGGAGGCTACHGLGTRAPDLIGVAGTTCATRQPELGCKTYLHESLVNPMAFVVEGFQPIMPDMSRTLSPGEIWALVAFLESQGGEITVTVDDIGEAQAAAAAAPPPAAGGQEGDPQALIEQGGCLACHQLEGQGGAVGPSFEMMGERDEEYLLRGIVSPNADTAQGFEAFAGTMPPTFGDMFTPEQLEILVRFLKGDR